MAIRIIRMTWVNVALIGLSGFALYMLIDRVWAHSPQRIAIMTGIVVAVVSVAKVPR